MAYECDPRIACADDPQPVLATRLVTDLTNGDTTALCDADWQLMVMAMASAWADTPAAPEPTDDQGDESDDDQDQDGAAAARLAQAKPPAAPDPQVSQVVRRGTSSSRKAHQARRASSARNQLPEPVQVPQAGVRFDDLAVEMPDGGIEAK